MMFEIPVIGSNPAIKTGSSFDGEMVVVCDCVRE